LYQEELNPAVIGSLEPAAESKIPLQCSKVVYPLRLVWERSAEREQNVIINTKTPCKKRLAETEW